MRLRRTRLARPRAAVHRQVALNSCASACEKSQSWPRAMNLLLEPHDLPLGAKSLSEDEPRSSFLNCSCLIRSPIYIYIYIYII